MSEQDAPQPTPPSEPTASASPKPAPTSAAAQALKAAQEAIAAAKAMQSGAPAPEMPVEPAAESPAEAPAPDAAPMIDPNTGQPLDPELAKLFAEAAAEAAPPAASSKPAPATKSVNLPDFGKGAGMSAPPEAIDLLSDVALNVKIELGRTKMLVEDVLRLGEGTVVELDKLAGDPVDIYVNERHVARGEILVLNDNFCVRINEILTGGLEQPQ